MTTDPNGLLAAIEALLAAGVRDEAARLLDRFGDDLVRAGCGAAVERCQRALDDGVARETPRALLLHARALAQRDPVESTPAFAAAHAAGVAAGDDRTALAAACGLLRSVFAVWNGFRAVPAMLAVANRAFAAGVAHDDPTTELESLTGLLAGRLLTRSSDEDRVAVVERMLALALDTSVHGAARLAAGGVLLAYCQLWSEDARGHALVRALDPLREDPAVGLEQRLAWHYESAIFLVYSPTRDAAQCVERAEAFRRAVAAGGSALSRFQLARVDFEIAMIRFDFEAAEAALAAMRQAVDARLAVQAITLAYRESVVALMQGQFDRSVAASRAAVAAAGDAGVPTFVVSIYRQIGALALGYGGDVAGGLAEMRALIADADARHRDVLQLSSLTIEVGAALEAGVASRIAPAVEALLGHAEAAGHRHVFSYCPPLGACAMAFALAHGIRPAFATAIVEAMRFRPPPDMPEAWPWTVRVALLGPPSVLVDGKPIGGKGKTQQRPLDLLKAIAIHGGDRVEGVDIDTLMRALWPDADADAKVSFDVTVLRLRKLLVHDGLVIVGDGRVRLDRDRVWCDVWAFDRRLRDDVAGRPSPWAGDPLALYRGPLFGSDQAPQWALTARERLRHRFLQAVLARGTALEGEARWDGALAIYERGLEQDAIAEDFYRAQMRCHLARGDRVNALRVYRRCREMLSIVLGVTPSAETEALYPRD